MADKDATLKHPVSMIETPEYLAQKGAIGHPVELARHPVIQGGVRGRVATSVHFPNVPVTRIVLEPFMTSDSTSFARQSTLAGHGVGFIPSVVVDGDSAARRLVDLFPGAEFPVYDGSIYLLYPSTQFVPAKVAIFRDFMIAALRPGAPK